MGTRTPQRLSTVLYVHNCSDAIIGLLLCLLAVCLERATAFWPYFCMRNGMIAMHGVHGRDSPAHEKQRSKRTKIATKREVATQIVCHLHTSTHTRARALHNTHSSYTVFAIDVKVCVHVAPQMGRYYPTKEFILQMHIRCE